jgi:hypothetical protein
MLVMTGCAVDADSSFNDRGDAAGDFPSVYTADDGDVEEPVAAGDDSANAGVEGAAPGLVEFTQTGTSFWSTTSVAVNPDGDEGLLGMEGGGGCVIFPGDGGLGDESNDHECPDEPIGFLASGGVVVGGVGCSDLVVQLSNRTVHIDIDGLMSAEIMGDQIVTVENSSLGCDVVVRDGIDIAYSAELTADACTGDMSLVTDAASETIYVAMGDLWVVESGEASMLIEEAGDMVALDRASGMLVTGFRGGMQIDGFSADGTNVWSQATDAPIVRMHEVGSTGAVLAHLEVNPSDVGRFVAYGVADGVNSGEMVAWPEVVDFDISENGRALVVSTGNSRVYSYGIRLAE